MMKFNYLCIRLAVLVAMTVLSGCGGSSGEPSSSDLGKEKRKEILTFWADKIIIPRYEAFDNAVDALNAATVSFTGDPTTETLASLKDAWKEAYRKWQTVELFEIGPAYDRTFRNFINIYPADAAGINAAIDDPSTNLGVPAAYTKQGFPALDYLLHGLHADVDVVVELYKTDTKAAARRAYLTKLVTRIQTLTTEVVGGWDSYRETFISKTGLDNLSSFAQVVNAFSLEYERYIRTGKIGIPSGATASSGGVAYPEKVEAFYQKEISGELALQAHTSAYEFFRGIAPGVAEPGPSFFSYLDDLKAVDTDSETPLSTFLDNQFKLVITKLEAVNPNLYEEVQENKDDVIEIHTEMQKLVAYIKVDMANTMSVSITYVDNDGD